MRDIYIYILYKVTKKKLQVILILVQYLFSLLTHDQVYNENYDEDGTHLFVVRGTFRRDVKYII